MPPLSTNELFEKFRKSVVLIKNKSYCKITFEDKSVAFFNTISGNYISGFTFNEEDARENASSCYGTGFFIGKNGLIATNFHVACGGLRQLLSEINFKAAVIQEMRDQHEGIKSDIKYYAQRLKRNHPDDSVYFSNFLPANTDENSSTDNEEDEGGDEEEEDIENTSVAHYHNVIDSKIELQRKIESVSNKRFKIEIIPVELSITLDGSTDDSNDYSCHLYSLTDNKNIDLAIIQTDSKNEPVNIGKGIDVFSTNTGVGNIADKKDTIKVSTPLFLVGYNCGPEIAQTSKGIKVQLTKGEVSQDNDDYRVLYSIPSLPGSSGSPVFNGKGQLVAINYCGYADENNFNYGVLACHLQKLLNKKPKLNLPD